MFLSIILLHHCYASHTRPFPIVRKTILFRMLLRVGSWVDIVSLCVLCRCRQHGCRCSTLCLSSHYYLFLTASSTRCWTGGALAHHYVFACWLAWCSLWWQCLWPGVSREIDWISTGTTERITHTGRW